MGMLLAGGQANEKAKGQPEHGKHRGKGKMTGRWAIIHLLHLRVLGIVVHLPRGEVCLCKRLLLKKRSC